MELVSDAIHMSQTPTGVRVLTHGRFPMSPVGLAAMTDYEFDGAEPKARMLVNGKQRKLDDSRERALEAKVEQLEAKLAKKDAVIAEISEEFVKVKKTLGEP